MKIAINKCYGGFGLSAAAYEKLIEWGIPVRRHVREERGENGLWKRTPENDGCVIFDWELTPVDDSTADHYRKYKKIIGRYWETWTRSDEGRTHPLVVRVIEELGKKANGDHAQLRIVEIPDGTDWEIDEYDGIESIREKSRSWS